MTELRWYVEHYSRNVHDNYRRIECRKHGEFLRPSIQNLIWWGGVVMIVCVCMHARTHARTHTHTHTHTHTGTHTESLPGTNPARIPVITFMLMNVTDQSDLIKIMIKEKRSVIAVTLTT